MGELEHDLSPVMGFQGYDEKYSDVSEFTQFLNAHNHLPLENGDKWVFWTPETYLQESSPLIKKIKLSLSGIKRYCNLVQFWAPKVEGKRSYLTTSEQPFAVPYLYKGMSRYREHCLNHKYIVADDEVGVKEEHLGAVGRVFLNGYPESSPDLRLYSTKDLPFRNYAARCGGRGYLVLPVFDLLKMKCYGVLELLSFQDLSFTRIELQRALEEADLRSTHLFTIQNKFGKPATSEIAKMLEAAVEAVPQLHMSQAWVRCKQCANRNTDLCCLERAYFVTAATKKVNDFSMIDMMLYDYLHACQWWNLQGIIAKMAMSSNIKSWFFRNICDFSKCENHLAHYAQKARLSLYFVISLESVHNNEDLYFVEFFLQPDSRQDPFGASFWHLLFGVLEAELKSYKVRSSDQQELMVIEIHKDILSGSMRLTDHNMSALMYGIQEHDQDRNHQFSKESNVLAVMNDYRKEYSSLLDFQKYFHMNVYYSCLKSAINGKHTYLFWCQQREELCVNKVNYSSFISTQDKIKLLLDKLLSEFNMTSYSLIQFWAPKMNEDGRRRYLETSGQIFVVSGLHKGLGFFRKRCMEHHYFVDQGAKAEEMGPPGRVFKSQHPEVTHDIRLYSTTEFPLKDDAVFCHLRTYFAFPVFDQMLKCVGVLEFVGFGNVVGDNNLISIQKAVKEQHLRLGHCNFKPSFKASGALIEIEEALQLVTQIPQLHKVEAWVPHHNCASTRNSLKCMEQVVPSGWFQKYPFDLVESGKGIVGTVLTSDNKCCYCRNSCFITEKSRPHHAQQEMLDVCFAICLHNSHTGDLPYVLKFFLNPGSANYEYLWSFLYFLLPILKQELKSFKVATGKQLGEELVVDVVEFSQVNQPTFFQFGQPNMFPVKCQIVQYDQQTHQEPNDEQVNEMDHVTSVLAEGKQSNTAYSNEKNETSRKVGGGKRKTGLRIRLEDLERQFGKSRKDAAENLSVSISTFKRACRSHNIHRWPYDRKHRKNPSLFMTINATEHDRDTMPSTSSSYLRLLQNVPQTNAESTHSLTLLPETDVVIVKAKYEDEIVKFQLSLSSGINRLAEEVSMRLNLEMTSFKLKYVDEDNDEILLTCDIDLKLCIKSLTASGNNCIQVIVQLIRSK